MVDGDLRPKICVWLLVSFICTKLTSLWDWGWRKEKPGRRGA